MNAQIIPRVMTALVAIPLLVLIIGWGSPWLFSLLVFLLTVGGLFEYFLIAFPHRLREQAMGIGFGVLMAMGILAPGLMDSGLWLAGVIMLACSAYLWVGGDLREKYQHLGWGLLGALYIGYLFPHIVYLRRAPDGRRWVFFVLLVAMVGDTAGFVVGSAVGKRKLAPRISPGKTVEGALGAVAASVLFGVLAGSLLLPFHAWMEIVLLCLILSVLAQTGDLFESWVKRVFSVKDSSAILPGHGGLLDRLDSLIFPVVFMAVYLEIMRS